MSALAGLFCIVVALLIAIHGAFGVYGDPSAIGSTTLSVVMYAATMGLTALGAILIWVGVR